MTELILDIETNGLKPDTIWCCGIKVIGEPEGELMMTGSELQTYLDKHEGATVYGHNGHAYDYPILRSLWDIDFDRVHLRDSVLMSREANPRRIGGHSLKAWGETLGFPKGVFSDWTKFTPEMGTYCVQDLNVTERLLEVVKEELKQPSALLEAKVSEIIKQQIAYGWLLDMPKCFDLLATLRERKDEVEKEVHKRFQPIAVPAKVVVPKVKCDGTVSRVGLTGFDIHSVGGDFTKVSYPEFNLGSRKQIGTYLMRFGWEPKTFTPTGQPVVDEGALEGSTIPEAQLIAEYLMVQKRIAQVQSWIDAVQEDGRVHGQVNACGAVTGRMTHSSPNMAQVPAVGAPYGLDCRSCWVVPERRKLVGVDASGLELRMLAHYMDAPSYTKEILEGDIHTANQIAAGLPTRPQAKTFIYAFLYGAGDAKIGSVVGGSARAGQKLKQKFLENTPALAELREKVSTASKRGYLRGLDGRRLWIRSEHAALNTLLQSAGAIIMKKSLAIFMEYAPQWKLDYKLLGSIHDEYQIEASDKDAEQVGILMVESIKAAGISFDMKCPLDGDYKIGNNWADTH